MGKSSGAAIPIKVASGQGTLAGGDELAQGLTLLRASTMKAARLQLAMERGDRRLIIETMDDLVTIDGRIRDLVDQIPHSGSDVEFLKADLEDERVAFAREKLALGAGVYRRKLPLEPAAQIDEPRVSTKGTEEELVGVGTPGAFEAEFQGPEDWMLAQETEAPRGRSASIFALTTLLILAAVLTGAGFLLGIVDGQGVIDGVLQAVGG